MNKLWAEIGGVGLAKRRVSVGSIVLVPAVGLVIGAGSTAAGNTLTVGHRELGGNIDAGTNTGEVPTSTDT